MATTPVKRETVGELKINIEDIFITILAKWRYYAAILNKISKTPTKMVPTAGVCFNPHGKIIMVYNPDYVNNLTLKEAQALFIHESLHILYRHLNRFPFVKDPQINKINNLGTDIAINQYIENLPEGALYPNSFQDEKGKPFLKDENADYYIEELKKLAKNGKGNGSGEGEGTIDDHNGWQLVYDPDANNGEGGFKDINGYDIAPDHEIESIVRKIAADLKKYGKLPAHLEREVKLIQEVKKRHDWKSTLRIFVNSMLALSKKLSSKRVNRRFVDYDYILPGKKKDRKPKIILARDTSGSVFNDDIQSAFLNEMINISKFCNIEVIDCDTEIQQEYKVKSVKDFKSYKGGGGTSFVPVFEKAKELCADGIIYLTDCCGTFPDINTIHKFKTKTIWVTVDQETADVPFGKILNISTKE